MAFADAKTLACGRAQIGVHADDLHVACVDAHEGLTLACVPVQVECPLVHA